MTSQTVILQMNKKVRGTHIQTDGQTHQEDDSPTKDLSPKICIREDMKMLCRLVVGVTHKNINAHLIGQNVIG